jgi:tetratricopeptide (TPR) repeat protein
LLRRLLCAASLACSASLCAAAGAQGSASQAAREFDRGTAAAARGDYLDAAAAFLRAYKLAPHAAPLYNAALAWEAAGDRPRAADAYASAMELGGLADGQARDAARRLRSLDAGLALLSVQAPAGATVSIAHAERMATPARIRLLPGEHALHAWFSDGRGLVRRVTVGVGLVELRLEPEQQQAARAPAATAPEAPSAGAPAYRVLGWSALGAGVVLGGVTAYLGTHALQARDDYYDSGRTDRDAYDRAGSYRTWTNVALGATAVAGAAGAVLLIKSYSRSSEPTTAGPGQASASLRVDAGSVSLRAAF